MSEYCEADRDFFHHLTIGSGSQMQIDLQVLARACKDHKLTERQADVLRMQVANIGVILEDILK